jgi:hypothetical protein
MKFIALVIFGVIASAQSPALQTINSTDLISSGPSKLNSNFSALNSGKVAHFVGSGAPGSIALSIQGDTYLDTVAQKVYTCFSLLCSTSPTWVVGSGGGTSPGGSSNDIQVNVAAAFAGGRCTMDSSQNIACNGGYTAGNGSGVAGRIDMGAGTTPASPPANSVGWGAPSTVTTANRINFPNAVPAAHQLAVFGAPASNISSWTFQTVPDCQDTGGNHLNFTQSTDGFTCGTSGGGGGGTSAHYTWIPAAAGTQSGQTVLWNCNTSGSAFMDNNWGALGGSAVGNPVSLKMTNATASQCYVPYVLADTSTLSIQLKILNTLKNNNGGNQTYVYYVSTACATMGTTNFGSLSFTLQSTQTHTINVNGTNENIGLYDTIAAFTPAGCSTGNMLVTKIVRTPGVGSDTTTNDLQFAGIQIKETY